MHIANFKNNVEICGRPSLVEDFGESEQTTESKQTTPAKRKPA